MPDPPSSALRRLRAAPPMRSLMADYYRELDAAAKTRDRRIAWCSSTGPVELLRSLGFLVYFPENHGAMLGASRRAEAYIPGANALGFSPEICSYLTSDIGAFLAGHTPLEAAYGVTTVPRPDVLVYNTNQCRDVRDWFAFYAERFAVPLLGIDSPRSVAEVSTAHLLGLEAQYQALVPPLSAIAARAFDIDFFREVTASSCRCSRRWKRVLDAAKARPSPISFLDATVHMGPAVVLRGDPRAEQYYELLLIEIERRVALGVSAVDDERHRLYWDGMPIWGRLRELTALLSEAGACVVASTYCNSWVFEALEHKDPFEAMARAYAELFIARAESHKQRHLAQQARDFAVDAFVFHDAKTCPNNSNNRYGLPGRLSQALGLPHVVLHGDLNDLRLCSQEQNRTVLEALLEQLGGQG